MNFNFDLLEIKTAIEEKRLIFGLKFEKFLNKNFKNFLNFIYTKIVQENFAFFSGFLVVLISLLIRSRTDIGDYSGYILDYINKLSAEYKNSPNFKFFYQEYLLIFLAKFSDFLAINRIIFFDYLINLFGISSIFVSYKILKNTKNIPHQIYLNLIILAFFISYFLRINALINNDFINKYSINLALIFIFLSYQICEIKNLNKFSQFKLSTLAVLMIAIDINFIIFVVFFEIFRFLKITNFKNIFCPYFFYLSILIFCYLVFLATFYGENFVILKSQISNLNFNILISKNTLENYSFYISLVIISFFIIKENQYLNCFLVLLISGILLDSLQNDQQIFKSIFYSFCFPATFLAIFNIKFLDRYFLKKYWFILITLIILFFSGAEFGEIISFYLSSQMVIILGLFLIIFGDYFKKIQKISQNFMIFLAIFIFLNHCGSIFRSIFSINDFYNKNIIDFQKTPNQKTNFLVSNYANFFNNNSKILWINPHLYDIYPFINYQKISNNSDFFYNDLTKLFYDKSAKNYYEKTLENLIKQMNNSPNSLFLSFNSPPCTINLLEFFLRDERFKKPFIENFKFHNSFIKNISLDFASTKEIQEHLTDDEFLIVSQVKNIDPFSVFNEFEVYVSR